MGSATLLAFTFGPTELVIVSVVALLLFGKRLPSLMRSLGHGYHEFRGAVSGVDTALEEAKP